MPLSQVGWKRNLPVLNNSDIKGLTDSSIPEYIKELHKKVQNCKDKTPRISEGHCDITWIWKQLGNFDNTDKLLQDGMSTITPWLITNVFVPDLWIKFCKSKAHADCWAEEVELLQEEMKQVKLFFEKHAENWVSHAKTVAKGILTADPEMAEGLHAFANEQALQFHTMHAHCEHLWCYIAGYVALGKGEIVPPEVQVDITESSLYVPMEVLTNTVGANL